MLLYDSTTPTDIPRSAPAVAYYVDGIYATTRQAIQSLFPSAHLIGIATNAATDAGEALDVERYDATPDQAAPWVSRRRQAGVQRPWVYCSRDARSAVEFGLNKFGILTNQVALWIATLDGTQTVPPGPYPIAAVQYSNAAISGGHFDISIVNVAYGPGGGTIGGINLAMAELVTGDNHDGKVYVTDWIVKRYITDPNALPGWYAIFGIQGPRMVPAGVLGEVPDQPVGSTSVGHSISGTFSGTVS